MLASFPKIRPGRMRAVAEAYEVFDRKSYSRAAIMQCNPEQPAIMVRSPRSIDWPKCPAFLAPFSRRAGPFVLDVTLSKMRKRSTNHGRSDEGEMPCASHDVTCSPPASAP